jgi:hypothetical protein
MQLTARAVAALQMPASKTDHIEWDDALPGFGYRLRSGVALMGGAVPARWRHPPHHARQRRRIIRRAGAQGGQEGARPRRYRGRPTASTVAARINTASAASPKNT